MRDCLSHALISRKSFVHVPNARLLFSARSEGTHTCISVAPTSIPATSWLMIFNPENFPVFESFVFFVCILPKNGWLIKPMTGLSRDAHSTIRPLTTNNISDEAHKPDWIMGSTHCWNGFCHLLYKDTIYLKTEVTFVPGWPCVTSVYFLGLT